MAALLAVSSLAAPAYADSGPGGGGGGGGGGGAGTTLSFKTFRMNAALFSVTAPATVTGLAQYTLDPTGRAKLVLGYVNTAHLPAGTALDVLADGVEIGTLITSDQGGVLSLDTQAGASLPRLTLQSQLRLLADGVLVASGGFTLGI